MLRSALTTALLTALSLTAAQAADAVGFRETTVPDASGARTLHVSLWYPTDDRAPTVEVGANVVFHGIAAIRDAKPDGDAHPLVVLSHGYGGNWRNLNWLGDRLAREGYVVAAPDHPGTTTFDKSPAEATRLWERPHDLRRAIDALIGDPGLGGAIAPHRIAAIGHSLGGWTVAALVGGRFSPSRFAEDCKLHPNPRTCGLAAELGITPANAAAFETGMSDHRIGAIVSLDLGLARGFTPDSLAAVRVPALIYGAGIDIGDLPAKLESGYLAENLPKPTTTEIEIPDALHFSFMQLCKPGAVDLLEAEMPGEGIVCKDGDTRSRKAIHDEVAAGILDFLAKAIPDR